MGGFPPEAGLFLGIFNWGGIDKCFGGGCKHTQRANLHLKTLKITHELGWVSSLNWGGGSIPPLGGVVNISLTRRSFIAYIMNRIWNPLIGGPNTNFNFIYKKFRRRKVIFLILKINIFLK